MKWWLPCSPSSLARLPLQSKSRPPLHQLDQDVGRRSLLNAAQILGDLADQFGGAALCFLIASLRAQ